MLYSSKTKQYRLRVESPCSENWEQMLPSEKGKFCQSCSKHVIDFTNLSDKEIINIISKSSGNICGKLTVMQLNRPIYFKKEKAYATPFSKIAASFLLLGLTHSNTAHSSEIKNHIAIELPKELKKEKKIEEQIATDSIITVKARVLDATTKEALPGVVVQIKNSHHAVFTDVSGYFKLDVRSDEFPVLLEISYTGYVTRAISLKTAPTIENDILLKTDKKLDVMGKLMVEPAPKQKKHKKERN